MRYALTLLALMFCLPLQAQALTVFAAASLREALIEIATDWETQTGEPVRLSFAASSALARQIAHGAPADVFISANPQWMDWLQDQGTVDATSRINVVGNTLALIAAEPVTATDIAQDLPGLLGDGRIAMAMTQSVPAGIYGKAALEALDLWAQVEPRVVQTDNVRAALAFVALGEARLGIVYGSDALAEPRVALAALFPSESHPKIVYPAVAITTAGTAFVTALTENTAQASFAGHGFIPLHVE